MAGDDHHRAVSLYPLDSASMDVDLTVVIRDRTADAIRKNLGISASELTLAQVLESATWKGGREIAKQKRPQTGGPPIDIESDGTVF